MSEQHSRALPVNQWNRCLGHSLERAVEQVVPTVLVLANVDTTCDRGSQSVRLKHWVKHRLHYRPPRPTPQVLEAMAEGCPQPIVLPLSRSSPEGQKELSEVAAVDALAWTQVGSAAAAVGYRQCSAWLGPDECWLVFLVGLLVGFFWLVFGYSVHQHPVCQPLPAATMLCHAAYLLDASELAALA